MQALDRQAVAAVDSTNQVDGARIGLAHNVGGPTAVSAITILGIDKGT